MIRRFVPRLAGLLAAVTILGLIGARPASAQGSVDIIAGRITDAEGKPVLGATVEALSIETDVTRRAQSNAKGDYIIFFNDGGGQYRVTVRAIGHTPYIINVSRQNDDDRISLDIKMTEQATRVETLIATGNRRPAADQSTAPTPGSTERLITGDMAMRLPIDASDLAALAALAPGVIFTAGTDSTSATFQVAGQSAESNSYLINGATTSSTTVPQDAVRSTRVITNSYDVSRGGFAGGQVSVTTKGGSNRVSGSASGSLQNQHLAWGEATDNPFTAGQTQNQVGGGYGGPLKRDKLFLFGSFQVRDNIAPLASLNLADPATLGRLGVAQDSVNEFITGVGALGLTSRAGTIDPNRSTKGYNSISRFDWNIGQVNIFTLTANLSLNTSDPTRIGQTQLQQVGGNTDSHSDALTAQLVSHMGRWLNRGLFSAGINDSKSNPFLYVPVGRVTNHSTLDSGQIAVTTFGFGGNSGLPQYNNQTNYELNDELSFLPGLATHRFALGLVASDQQFTQDVTNNRYGTYTYASLSDFSNNIPSQFTRTLQPTIRDGGIVNKAVYLSDAWRPRSSSAPAGRGGRGGAAGGGGGGRGGRGGRGGGGGDIGAGPTGGNSNFQLIYGVRLEHSSYTGTPALNQAVLDEFHVRTDHLPSETYVTPRIGFQYAIPSPEQQGNSQRGFAPTLLTIRGGAGIFRGTMPATLPGTAQAQSGLSTAQQQLICVGSAVPIPNWTDFLNDPNTIPDECVDNQSTAPITGRPTVTTYDPNYGAPKTKRASLGVTRRVTTRITFNVDASYVRGVGQSAQKDLNLNETPKFLLGGVDGRPVYADPTQIVTTTGQIPLSASRIDPNFGSVNNVFSALENETKQVTLNLAGTTSKQIQLNLSYTLMYARDEGGAGGGLGGGGNQTAGDPNVYTWATSSNDRRHNIQATINWPVTPAFELTGSIGMVSGTHYTPIVSGDINGDGSSRNDRAFIYNAANAPDTAVASAMGRLLTETSGNARSCLLAQAGTIAARNSCTGPWQPTLNLQLNWRPNLFRRQLSLSFRPVNLLGGIDELIHGANNLSGWGLTLRPDNTLMTVKGFDPVTNQFKYVVNERFGATSAQTTATRTPFQLQLQVRYAIGYDPRTQQIQALGQRGFNPSQADAKTLVDTFLVRYRRQNAAQAALDRKDSLALLPAQITKLQALLDSSNKYIQPEVDTLVIETDKVKKAGTSADPVPLATRIRTFTQAAVREQNRVHDAVRVILDEVQWALLPDFVRNPSANLTGGGPGGRGGAGGGAGGGGGGGGRRGGGGGGDR